MIHRGEIVERAVRSSGIPLTRLAAKMGKSRRWIYNAFETADLSLDTIIEIGKIIHYDFSNEITQIAGNNSSSFNDGKVAYGDESPEYWKDKYYKLLEEYNALLKQQASK